MASPWVPQQRSPIERPWMGMAMLAALPLLSLILIRMLWSGSSLWFLTVGIILLGAAAVVFLARRPQEMDYGHQTLAPEQNRIPLVLSALGVFFLAMLLLPNFAGSGEGAGSTNTSVDVSDQVAPAALDSAVSGISEPPAQQDVAPAQQDVLDSDLVAQTYVIQDGDTLWDVAASFDVTVDAIVDANDDLNPADLQIGLEITIPAPEAETASNEGFAAPADEE